MSKVKIQGNASGTGVVTLTASNTNTDRTITLPDSTGSILMSDGDGSALTNLPAGGVDGIVSTANATAITIDASENVAVSNTLDVNGRIRNSSGTNPLDLLNSGTTHTWDANGSDISFYASGERMRIDSAGRVTMPSQPAMSLSGTQQTYAPRTAAGTVKYNIALSGNITGWSNSLYRYTAPVAGMYQVSGWALISTASTWEMRLVKNGVINARYYEVSSRSTSFNTLIYLNVNDYIEIYSQKDIYLHTTAFYSGLNISLHS
jgi:hypothetical protein